MYQLNETQIVDNWNLLREELNKFTSRKDALNKMYDHFEDRMSLMPASGTEHYHNAIPGGYVDHILRVLKCCRAQYQTWTDLGANMDGFTLAELEFAALHHDLGKVGFPEDGKEVYIPNPSQWHREKQGKIYTPNPENPFSMVPDLSLWLLQKFEISTSWNEYQAIRIHDGLYDDANKAYFMSYNKDAKLRTNLPYILHHSDHLAALIEYNLWKEAETGMPKKAPSSPKAKNMSNGSAAVGDFFKEFNG